MESTTQAGNFGISYSFGSPSNATYGSNRDFVEDDVLLFLHENMQVLTNVFSIPTVACGALMGCVAAAGIIGNIFNVYIFSKRSMGNASIGVLLTGLSAVDALLLFVAAPLFASSAIYVYRPSFRLMTFIAYMTAYAYPCASTLQTASVWLMMVATMDRWIGVCRPFLARAMCTRARAKATLVVVLAVSLAYNACRFWEYQPTPIGQDSAMVALPRLREDKHYIRIYVHWMYFVFIFAIPFVVLSLVNGMVVLTIQKAKRDRRHLTRQQRKEHATAALMVIVAFAYITCNSLAFVLNALELWGASGVHDVEIPDVDESAPFQATANETDQFPLGFISNQTDGAESAGSSRTTRRHSNFFYFLIDLNNLLVMIHCSVNFLIYYKFSQRFRAHVQSYVFGQTLRRLSIGDGDGVDSQSSSHRGSRLVNGHSEYESKDGRKSLALLIPAPSGRHVKHIYRNGTRSFDESGDTYVPHQSAGESNRKHSAVDRQSTHTPFSASLKVNWEAGHSLTHI